MAAGYSLKVGELKPGLQRQFLIISLGSAWRRLGGRRRVAYLSEFTNGSHVCLLWFDARWLARCRFVTVRKLALSTSNA
jgi:hypothetical protein